MKKRPRKVLPISDSVLHVCRCCEVSIGSRGRVRRGTQIRSELVCVPCRNKKSV